MQTDDLLMKAKSGDKQARLEWFQTYQLAIAKFAYQSGIAKEKIPKFQLDLFNEVSNSIETIDSQNAENKIMELAVRLLKGRQTDASEKNRDLLLKFPEDEETHAAIQKLPLSEKIALVLFQFHGKSEEDIDKILLSCRTPIESTIEMTMEELKKSLSIATNSDVQKRLDLLAKSYNRIEYPQKVENSIEELPPAVAKPVKQMDNGQKSSISKRTFAILVGASLFLTAVIGASFLFNNQPVSTQQTAAEEENPTIVSKNMVKKWKAEYDQIRENAPKRLGLSVENFEQLEYVNTADALKERTFSKQNVKQLKEDPERMQKQVDTLMLTIHTPKGMLDSVDDYKLMSADISKFFVIYTEKTNQLKVIADGLLEQYKEELSTAEMNGQLSTEQLTSGRGDYPEEIENLTAALSEYTFHYTVHPNENRFTTIRDVNKFYEIHPFNSDYSSITYLDILRTTPFFDESGLLWPIEQLPYSVVMMAAFVSDPMSDPVLRGKIEPQLVHAFFTLLKGDEHTEIFDKKGVVKEEFQIAWQELLQHNNNPVTYMMLPILEEFEESDWKESAHYDQLAYPDILYAVDLESKGELAEKMPNGNLEIESARLDMENYDYSDIEKLYAEFSSAHDVNILSGVEPMEIIKLYHYANKLEDAETMWHLTANDELKPSFEAYKKGWKKRPEITKTLRFIEIYKENIHRQGRIIYLMALGQNVEIESDRMSQNMTLVTESDQIWLMQHQMDEYYSRDKNFENYDANVKRYYKNIAESGNMDSLQGATPAEIAGVFLLGLENDDLKTMRVMVHETDESISDDEFKEWWFGGHLTVYSKMTGISFNVDALNLDIYGVRGNVDIIMKSETMEDSRYLPMEKVDDTWMIGDMFNY